MSELEVRALALFDEYAELAPPHRAVALKRLKAREPALHDALLRLLAADAAAHPLEDVAFDTLVGAQAGHDVDAAVDRIGNRLGPWRIDRVLESGGMGTVYEASRVDGQYEKQVALKCMRAEMSTPALIDAFMRERTHLAQLDHPHIAHLLDGGVEEDGRPWFAMRLVHGTAMDVYANQHRLALAARVRLLLQACQALRYAHGRRVLHQDIKPCNLLVSADGRVHLIDFGLSAMIDGLDGDHVPRLAITNGYTAPEVLAGGIATATSDIHSIGVMLYQLLVGDWPRPLQPLHAGLLGRPAAAPARAPSALASTASADTAWQRALRSPRRLQERLRGDLDAIALKAVAHAPADRYASVDALIDDLQRWLARRPVMARGGGRAYVVGRFVHRNALACMLAGGVVLVATGGASVVGWSYVRDRQELRDMQAVSAVFEQTLGAVTLSGLADARPSSRHMLQLTEQQLRDLPLHSNPAIKARAMASLARSYAALGDYAHALALAGEAHRLLADDPAASADTQAMLAMLLNLQARHAEARDIATRGLAQSAGAQPAADPSTLSLLVELARAHWGLAEYDSAFNTLAFAQESTDGASSQSVLAARATLLLLRAQWHLQLLDLAAAERDLQDAAAAAPRDASVLADDIDEARLSLLLLQQRPPEAARLAASLLADRRQRLGAAHPDTARSLRLQLEAAELGPDAEAVSEAALQAARQAIAQAYGTRHPEYAQQLWLEARVAMRRDAREGLALATQAVTLLEQTLGPRHPATLGAKETRARALLALADTATADGARALREEAIGLLRESVHAARQRQWPAPSARFWLAQALLDRAGSVPAADRRQAETLLQDALVEARRQLGAGHATTVMIRDALIRRYQPPATTPAAASPDAPPPSSS
nr:serine/threonine-protein kinase [uncultured Pseudoxanthomonas sp.]